jgi:Rrf2 family protein
MISRKGKYAIKAALFLARRYGCGPVAVEEISSSEGISRKFLETIMQEMKRAGVLNSQRGKQGGYTLRKSPREITIGKVLRSVGGPLAPISCVSASRYKPCEDCSSEGACHVRLVMMEVREAISRVLDLKTLDKLLTEGLKAVPTPTFDI